MLGEVYFTYKLIVFCATCQIKNFVITNIDAEQCYGNSGFFHARMLDPADYKKYAISCIAELAI